MAPVLGLVLAGGLSRRMGGGDKPLLQLGGRSLLDRVLTRLMPQCPAGVVLNANGDPARFSGFPGRIVPDDLPDRPGPLAGILAGLDHAARQHPDVAAVVSVTGDVPFLPGDLVARLSAARGDGSAAMAASDGRQHYTIALWAVSLRHDLREALVVRGERRVGAFLDQCGAAIAAWPCEPVDPFANVNTPGDLADAEALLARFGEGADAVDADG
ncbi:molybdenum cofactor guanylyltransferase MobA [Methylobacterium trifolii]